MTAEEELLEQKLHVLDARLRRAEDERDLLIMENEELQEQVTVLAEQLDGGGGGSQLQKDEASREEELIALSEEISRMDMELRLLRDSHATVQERVKEVTAIKEAVRATTEETLQLKDDFQSLKTQLTQAAKIELQANEKMYESRLLHLERMLDEMRHREENLMHLAEETNILKDQVDSLRELSIATATREMVKQEGRSQEPMALDDELGQQLENNTEEGEDLSEKSCGVTEEEVSPPPPVSSNPTPTKKLSSAKSEKLKERVKEVLEKQHKQEEAEPLLTSHSKMGDERQTPDYWARLLGQLWDVLFD